MKKLSLTFTALVLIISSSCERPAWLGGKSGLSSQKDVDPIKAEEFDTRMKSGDLTGAINQMVDPPCTDCARTITQGPKVHGPLHMVGSVANMNCFKEAGKNASANAKINLSGASSSERSFATQISKTMSALAGPQMATKLIGGLKVVHVNKLRTRRNGSCLPAHQLQRGEIQIARKCSDGTAVYARDAILVHEIGHYAANNAGLYDDYNRFVTSTCRVSTYCTHDSKGRKFRNRNEEFAEAFSSYLLASDRLKAKCPRAHEFFRTKIFNKKTHNCPSL